MQVIILCPKITPRVAYITETLIGALGIKHFRLTDSVDEFKESPLPKINYSDSFVDENEFRITPAGLVHETGINFQTINCLDWKDLKAFFPTQDGDLPFDIFSASFYLISRYEEYLPHSLDFYGRYAHENSLAFKEDFLHVPLVNLWLKEWKHLLQEKFPELQFNSPAFKFIPTYDIDIAWSYLHKGWKRNLGGFFKSLINRDFNNAIERLNVLSNKQKDPFDSFDWLDALHKKYALAPIYFFLLAKKNKGYDKNILPEKKELLELIKVHSEKYDTGIHPSWQSVDDPELLKNEIEILQGISGKKINRSRQHYIRMFLPVTYRNLIDAGITEDYSMGYGSINGFRASYCLPHYWYDLEKELATGLKIFPFCYMEANSFYEQHYTVNQAAEELEKYFQIVKSVNGNFITIWHNHFLGTDNMFKGWKEMYEDFIRKHFKV